MEIKKIIKRLPLLVNVWTYIQGETFLRTLENISRISNGNEMIEQLLFDNFIRNPNKKIKHNANSLIMEHINIKKNASSECNYFSCTEKSILSHELSKKSVLKTLSTNDYLYMLKRDLKKNAFCYAFCKVHINSVSTFSGYCKKHDQDIFNLLDNDIFVAESEIINLQCLRSLRSLMRDKELDALILKDIIDSLQEILDKKNFDNLISDQISRLNEKYKIILNSKVQIDDAYEYLQKEIKNGNKPLMFKILECNKLGWAFSSVFDLSKDNDRCFLFIIKIDVKDTAYLIVAYFDNQPTREIMSVPKELESLVLMLIYNKKTKLIFSDEFINQLTVQDKKILFQDHDLYENELTELFYRQMLLGLL